MTSMRDGQTACCSRRLPDTLTLDSLRPLMKLYVTWYVLRYCREIEVFGAIVAQCNVSQFPDDPVQFFEQFAELELPKKALTVPPSA